MDSLLHVDEEIANIYNRQYKTVYRICFSFMKNAVDAEDMAQETFLKLISSKKQFESQEHEKAWLIVTASNTCKDELRQWKRRLEKIKSLSQQEIVVQEEDDKVLEWVMALPVKYKQVIYLYYYEGYHTSEIASMLHCSESTVRNQLLRGRRLLKKNSMYHAKTGVFWAVVLAGSLLVTSTVYAVYTYGLRDLHLGKENVLDLSKREELPEEVSEKDIPKKKWISSRWAESQGVRSTVLAANGGSSSPDMIRRGQYFQRLETVSRDSENMNLSITVIRRIWWTKWMRFAKSMNYPNCRTGLL